MREEKTKNVSVQRGERLMTGRRRRCGAALDAMNSLADRRLEQVLVGRDTLKVTKDVGRDVEAAIASERNVAGELEVHARVVARTALSKCLVQVILRQLLCTVSSSGRTH